jgi:tight adherence protein B
MSRVVPPALVVVLAATVLVAAAVLFGAQVQAAMIARRVRARLAGSRRGAGPPAGRPSSGRPAPAVVASGAAGLVSAALVGGPSAAVVLALGGAALPAVALLRRRAARRTARTHQLPEALDRLATSMRSGSSLPLALDEAGRALGAPLGPELVAIARATRRGRSVRRALDEWSATHDDPGTRLAATALVLSEVVGSTPARAVDGVAATLRERLDLAAERRALAVQARTSSLVLSVAPVGVAAVLVVADTAAARFLLGSPAGAACLAVGLGLDGLGAWWMTRLCRSDGR